MPVTNNNLRMVDRPVWEQLTPFPANTAVASCMVDDNSRYIYVLITSSSFWSYDTWTDTWIQLPNVPGTPTLAAGTCMRFVHEMGGQVNGETFGSVYILACTGAAVTFYRYDIATATWSGALSVTNVPAAFATDGRIVCPEPALNGFAGGYHSNVALNTITATAQANAGATSISVTALPLALPIGARLNFGTASSPVWAVLTAAAAASATSITVSALIATVNNASVAYFYGDMFLTGNNATVVYRYNLAGNAWTTTSANSANPAIPAVTAALGAGHVTCWLPGSGDANALNRIIVFRSTATGTIYEYDLVTNTFSTVTYYPNTETFTTGTSSGIRMDATGKNAKLIVQKDITGRFFEFDRKRLRVDGRMTQNLYASGVALVGDKTTILKSPEGIEFLYHVLSTSAIFMRSALVF